MWFLNGLVEKVPMKKPATESQWRMRESLREMAARGTEHEAKVAVAKLTLLEEKYVFGERVVADEVDWFRGWPQARASGTARVILNLDPAWMDAGNVVKWVLASRLKVSTQWKMQAGKVQLAAGVGAADARRLQPLARKLYENVVEVSREFFTAVGSVQAGEIERAPFIDGISDGLSGEVRAPGAMSPGRSPHPPKKRKKRRGQVSAKVPGQASAEPPRHAAVHPYEVGLTVGRKIRLAEELPSLLHAVRAALQLDADADAPEKTAA